MIFIFVILGGTWLLSRQRWLPIREAYVYSHWMIAPKVQKISGLDLSENSLYTQVLPKHGYEMPTEKGGCIWDVGANNGVFNSNSHYLIHERAFKGFLYEPDAGNFVKLRTIYQQDKVTELFNFGLGTSNDILRLKVFPLGFENTIVSGKSNQYDELSYHYSISMVDADLLCKQLRNALNDGLCDIKCTGSNCGSPRARWKGKKSETDEGRKTFTVLSIDIEGAGASVLRAAHRKCGDIGWDLLIIETPPGKSSMKKLGYEWIFKDKYNDVFQRATKK